VSFAQIFCYDFACAFCLTFTRRFTFKKLIMEFATVKYGKRVNVIASNIQKVWGKEHCCAFDSKRIMFPESANDDQRGSKEVKERRGERGAASVYTVDTTEKTSSSMNCVTTVNYCDDQSPLSTFNHTGGRQKNSAWRYCTAIQPGRGSPLHSSNRRRSAASNECLRRCSETSSPAEVINWLSPALSLSTYVM